MSIKKQLLDTLGTVCKLISLNFTVPNTKLSIHNHILQIQQPNNYQFIIRALNGDGKENISDIDNVIVRLIKWYLHVDAQECDENWYHISQSLEIKRLILYICTAFKQLQKTYQYGNVVLAIQFYINILEDAINGTYSDSKLPQYIIDKENILENLLDYSKLKNFWTLKQLQDICKFYDVCFAIYNEPDNKNKDALLSGYINSINVILDNIEVEFQKLILNSFKG